MAYNLRREFLVSNKEAVEQLIRLADSREWVRIDCATPAEAQGKQYRINNLLYSLSRYFPERRYVREAIRTKLEWADDGSEAITLWVGVPPAGVVLRGSKPLKLHAMTASREGTYKITEYITEDNWQRLSLGFFAAAVDPATDEILFMYPPDADGIRFIAEQLAEYGFAVEQTAPVFRLRKQIASVSIALESGGRQP